MQRKFLWKNGKMEFINIENQNNKKKTKNLL